MAQNDSSMRAIGGVSAVKPYASSFKSKKRGKSRKKKLSAKSKAANLPPDLDIVSGFAFLSFSTIEELECHIEDHEVNTRSLSINVGEKRKKSAPKQQKRPKYTADSSEFVHSKRIKTPSQKILESYATSDLNLNKVVSNVSRELKRTKIRPFPGSKATSTNLLNQNSSSTQNSDVTERKEQYLAPTKIDLTAEETSTSEISLECSERISLFDEEDKLKQELETYPTVVSGIELSCTTGVGTEIPGKKKKKKRKRDRSIHDQTCQTMFRIKKKKKDFGNESATSIKSDEKQNESPSSFLKIEEEMVEENLTSSNSLSAEADLSETTGSGFKECEKVTSSSVSTETNTNEFQVEDSIPQEDDSISQVEDSILQVEDSIPQEDDSIPQEEGIIPQEDDSIPQEEDSISQEDNSILQEDDSIPQEEDSISQEDNSISQVEDSISQEDNSISQVEDSIPQVEDSIPQVEEEMHCSVPRFQPKSHEFKVHRLKVSNKVEKIDYCARSGGVSLVERHHERQNKYKEDESAEELRRGQRDNDSHGSNTVADNLSENSGNDSSNNSNYGDQESLMSVKSRIFAGSSSVFISSVDESNDTSDIEIELNEADASKPMIDIVKALPKSYMFGHLSSFPDKTTKGTIDVSLQVYENDIQLYMNYAADFKGRIIKIIMPDNEDSKNSCYLKSPYLSGLPKFLQPQEYVKAVRSATERNRRHTIGDLFQSLKNELFSHVRNYYFSKQAILSKAIERMEQYEVEGQLLESEKNVLKLKNRELRSRLNLLLFGKDLDDDKLLDINKVTEHLQTLGIKVEIPTEVPKRDEKTSQETQSNESDDISDKQKKYVTRKGRPLTEAKKLAKALQSQALAKMPKLPKPKELSNFVRAAFDSKMKQFVVIAPSDNKETSSADQRSGKEVMKPSGSIVDAGDSVPVAVTSDAVQNNPLNDPSVNKIVCNLTKYRIHQQPRSSGTLTIVTNPEPVKGIQSKNVVHIKISHDKVKQIGVIPSISTLDTGSKHPVSSNTKNIDHKQNKQEPVGTEELTLSSTKESQGIQKPTIKVTMPLDVTRNPSTVAINCKSEALAPENVNSTSLHLPLAKKELISDNQSQAEVSETENIKKSTEGTAEESATSSSSCPKGEIFTKDTVPHSSADAPVTKEVTMATGAAAGEESKAVGERGSAHKPQCSSQVSVSHTLPQHQLVPPVQKKYTTIKSLQGTPLISLAKMQQQMVLTPRVSVTTADNISIQNKVAMMKQVITTKANTPQNLNVIPVTAKSSPGLPVLKMKQLRPAPSPMQQNVALLPMATQGTSMSQMTPITLAKVVTSQSISKLPTVTTNVTMITHSTGMVQMMPSIGSKFVTPQSIAVLPLPKNVTMATHSKPNIQITPSTVTKLVTPIQTNAAQQNITLVPVGTKVKPIIQVPQAVGSKVAVAPPQGIPVSGPAVTQSSASGYVALVHTPSPNKPPAASQKTFVVPSSSIAGTATPFRIVFKPTGQPKVYNAPFPQIKNALQSSSVIGVPTPNTASMQQTHTSVSTTSVPAHYTGILNTKAVFQDKVAVTNKQVTVQNTGNVSAQYRHSTMNAPPLQVVNVSQPPQTKTLVRVQQATPTPTLSSISPVPEQATKPSKPLTAHVQPPSEVKDVVSKPSTTVGVPVQSTSSSIRQLLVSVPMSTQAKQQDPSNIHPKVHTSVAAGQNRPMATFNIAVPLSASLQNPSPRKVTQASQAKERGLSETQVSQLTPLTTSVSTGSLGSKETFSEIEKILAKIPSPTATNTIASSGNNPGFSTPTSILRSNVVNLSCPQNLDYSSRTMKQAIGGNTNAVRAVYSMDGQVFNSVVRPQQIADAQRLPLSQMITSSTKSPPFTSVSTRDRIPPNPPSHTNSGTDEATFSSTCSSTTETFDNPKPKVDKTCSVVDSPEVISHMVSADTLSICNIDSSIPDITSELPSQLNPASHAFSSLKPTMKEWPGNKETSLHTKETKKTVHGFELRDESTAEDFDLLSTFEWNNNAPNESSTVSSSGRPYKTGDT